MLAVDARGELLYAVTQRAQSPPFAVTRDMAHAVNSAMVVPLNDHLSPILQRAHAIQPTFTNVRRPDSGLRLRLFLSVVVLPVSIHRSPSAIYGML